MENILNIFYPLLKSQSGEQEAKGWNEPIDRETDLVAMAEQRRSCPHTQSKNKRLKESIVNIKFVTYVLSCSYKISRI